MFQRITRLLLYTLLAFFLVLMIRIILPYLGLDTDVAFLRIKQQYLDNQVWLIAFFVHTFTAVITLLAGFTQFSKSLRMRLPHLHRAAGKLYVWCVLALAAPSGLIIALYANGRLPSRIGFVLLALLWFLMTYKALIYAKQRNFPKHRNFMIRSYALTLSAITLRLWKFGLANTIAPEPLLLYQMVTWLGFIPNMLIAEWVIRYLDKRNK